MKEMSGKREKFNDFIEVFFERIFEEKFNRNVKKQKKN